MHGIIPRLIGFLNSMASDEQMYVIVLFISGGIPLLAGGLWLWRKIEPRNAWLICTFAMPFFGAWVYKAAMPAAAWGTVLIWAMVIYLAVLLFILIRR